MTQKQIKARTRAINEKLDLLNRTKLRLDAELKYIQTYLCEHPVKLPAPANGIFVEPPVCDDCGKQRKMTKEELSKV